jgi:hypothetical protein
MCMIHLELGHFNATLTWTCESGNVKYCYFFNKLYMQEPP